MPKCRAFQNSCFCWIHYMFSLTVAINISLKHGWNRVIWGFTTGISEYGKPQLFSPSFKCNYSLVVLFKWIQFKTNLISFFSIISILDYYNWLHKFFHSKYKHHGNHTVLFTFCDVCF